MFLSSAGDPWMPYLTGSYMVSLPKDPQNSGSAPWAAGGLGFTYGYISNADQGADAGTYFMLVAHMESPNSADKQTKCGWSGSSKTQGSTDSGANWIYPNTFWVCSQQ